MATVSLPSHLPTLVVGRVVEVVAVTATVEATQAAAPMLARDVLRPSSRRLTRLRTELVFVAATPVAAVVGQPHAGLRRVCGVGVGGTRVTVVEGGLSGVVGTFRGGSVAAVAVATRAVPLVEHTVGEEGVRGVVGVSVVLMGVRADNSRVGHVEVVCLEYAAHSLDSTVSLKVPWTARPTFPKHSTKPHSRTFTYSGW